MKKDLIKLDNEKSVMNFLREPTVKIAETITGILVAEQKDWKLSAGKLVQAVIKGGLLTQLGRELEMYRNEGKIKEDYFASNKNKATLYELLKFLDEEIPDEELFKAMKSIFFSGISVDAGADEELWAYEFLRTAKKLSGTETLILKANLEIAQNRINPEIKKRLDKSPLPHSRSAWRKFLAIQMGYGDFDAIVGKYESNLETLGLISRRAEDNRFAKDFEPTQKYRLTEFGYKFCEFMTRYE